MDGKKDQIMYRNPDYQKQAQDLLLKMHKFYGSWADVGEEFGINRGLLCAISKGKREASDNVLRKLGFDVLPTVAVAVCPHCGQPPLSKRHRCADMPAKPRHPSLRTRRKRLIHDERWRQMCARMRRQGLSLTFAGLLANIRLSKRKGENPE